ncbi:MAG: GNAT family N-acetyltransferase, partial [Acidimicrobiales bacterium]
VTGRREQGGGPLERESVGSEAVGADLGPALAGGADPELGLAGRPDLDTVIDLLSQGSAYARSRGFEQWPARFPAGIVSAGIEREEVYLARIGGIAVATCWLAWSNESFWGPDDGMAGYLHRLAVAEARRGEGLGRRILDWAQERATDAGRPLLRLDCMADNRPLRSWYEADGFVLRGERQVRPPEDAAHAAVIRVCLYERAEPRRADVPGPAGARPLTQGPG